LRGAPDAENTFDAPTNVHTVTVPVRLNNAAVLEYEVPAMSVTTIRIKKE
jgi:alpha-L-arabinofuranosidase